MDLKLRLAEKKDMAKVLQLIKELATFEKQPDAVEITERDLVKDGFGTKPSFKVILAEYNEEIAGMALFYNRYSTWKGRSLHLEDLIIKKEYRNKGIGTKLYKAVLQYAVDHNLKRVAWEVLEWNTVAIDFYKATGAKIFEEWRIAQIDKDNLLNYIKED